MFLDYGPILGGLTLVFFLCTTYSHMDGVGCYLRVQMNKIIAPLLEIQ